jgi:phosphosulfolactate phosphohydrolase-like enzyme
MARNGVFVTVNASGAVQAAQAGQVVIIIDVIDMSTTLEAALDAGAAFVLGASPKECRAPVSLSPENVGRQAGELAISSGTAVIIVSEPRIGTEEERRAKSERVISGIKETGAIIEAVLPNAGAEITKMADFRGKIVVAVSDTGGVAYDAAVTAGAPAVLTGTIARTIHKRGIEPAREAAARAIKAARQAGTGIAVVAASANSLEDILAAEYIMKEIIAQGFTAL